MKANLYAKSKFTKLLSILVIALVSFLLPIHKAWAQFPHPTPQALPYSENFNTSLAAGTTTTYPAGWRAYKLASSAPSSSGRTSVPTADIATLGASGSGATSSGGAHNYTAKMGIQPTASYDVGMLLSLNTTGSSNIKLNFDLMTMRNPYDGSTNNYIVGLVLMYRTDTSSTGTFTTITYSPSEYQNNTTTQTSGTTGQQIVSCTVTLPSACDNKSVVEIRWGLRSISGSAGSRPGFAIDNVSAAISAAIPTLSTTVASSILSTSATTGGNISADGGATVTRRGLIYSTVNVRDTNSTSGGGKIIDANGGTGSFSTNLTGLNPGTTYKIRAFAVNSAGIAYGDSLTFTTLAILPTITTNAATSISVSSAVSGGNISSNGGAAVTRRGLIYSTGTITDTTSTTGGGILIDASGGNGNYSLTLNGLTLGTTYHIMAFAVNSVGVAYGSDLTFTTLSGTPPTVGSLTINGITNSSVTLGSTVTADGGSALTAAGTVYNTTSIVTATDNAQALSSVPNVGDAFTDTRSSLFPQTLYYAAAYASNVGGTSLGAVSSFRTLSNPPTAAATNLSATAASGEQINLNWTAATYPASGATNKGYVLLIATSPNLPTLGNTNGAAPSAGANTTIVSFSLNGTTTSSAATGLSGNTTYNFALVPYTWDGVNASTYNYLTSDIASATGTTIASTPLASASNLRFTNITCNGMTVTWDNASPSVSGYLVLRNTGAVAPNTAPTSATAYATGDVVGNATVVYIGADTNLIYSSLPDSTNYNFRIFSYNGSGSNASFLTSSSLSGSKSTLAVSAPNVSASNIYSNAMTANWTSASCASSYNLSINSVENFENSMSLFTVSGGAYYSGTNTGGAPSSALYSASGSYGYGVINGTAVLTSTAFNTSSSLSAPTFTFKLSALGYGSTGQGMEASDTVKVEVSPDNGITWYYTLKIYGGTSANWAFTAGGIASANYDADNIPAAFTGTGSGSGLSTVSITGLPTVSKLKIRISMTNNSTGELWMIDEFKLQLNTYNNLTSNSLNLNNLSGGTPYTLVVIANGTNSTKSTSFIVSTLASATPGLGTASVSNISNTSATLTANVANIGSTAVMSARGIAMKTATGVTLTDNPVVDAYADTGTFSQNRTDLLPQTRYYFKGFATNAEGTGYSSEVNFYTLSNPPLAQPASMTATPFSASKINLTWPNATFPTTGATYRRYLLLRAKSPNVPVFTGSNGNIVTVGDSTTIVDQYISYDSTLQTISVGADGLEMATSYNFLLIPYCTNGNSLTNNFLINGALTTTGSTSSVLPPVMDSTSVTNITQSSATLGATITADGGADIIERGTVYSTSYPVSIANNKLEEGQTGLGIFTQNRSNLLPQTRYYFAGYAVNAGGAIALSRDSSFYTHSNSPVAPSASLTAVPVSGSSIKLTWTPATFPDSGATSKRYLLLRAVYPNVPSFIGTDGGTYLVDTLTTIDNGGNSIADTITTFTSTGLNPNSRYNYTLVPFTWNGSNGSTRNYLLSGNPLADATTFALEPTSSPTNLSFSNITCNGMTLTWKNPTTSSVGGYLVLQSSGATAPATAPTSGTVYNAGNTVDNAVVAYVGSDTSFVLSNLTDLTAYNFRIYSYNGSVTGNISYKLTSPLSGTQLTIAPNASTALNATSIGLQEFTANWNAATCASNGYRLDVSTYPTFFNINGPTTTVASEGFENGMSLFTVSRGAVAYSNSNGIVPTTPQRFAGSYGLIVNNNKSTITSNTIDVSNTINNTLTFRLAAFGSSTSNGLDPSDSVTVEISTDGGITYYKQLQVTGGSGNNVQWGFTGAGSGDSTASKTFDASNNAIVLTPVGTNATISHGYGKLVVSGIPSVNNLKIKISLANNAGSEVWAIDSLAIFGYQGSFVSPYNNFSVSGTSQLVTGLTNNTNYYYRVRTVGTNATSVSSNTISVRTLDGFATLNNPIATSITNNSAVLGATVTSSGAAAGITERGTVYKTSNGVTIADNVLAEGDTLVGDYSHTRSGLAPQTTYYFAGYASNTYGTGISAQSSFITLSNPPESAIGSLNASYYSGDQIKLNWTPATFPSTGATAKGYVIVRAEYPNTPVLANSNGQAASAGANSTIVNANVSANDTASIAGGLTGNTRYNFVLIPFTWNGTDPATTNYYTANAPMADATTLPPVTAEVATDFNASSITCNGMTIGWTAGNNADGSLVLQTSGTTTFNSSPVPGTNYNAGEMLGNAKVVYAGSGNTVALTGLSDTTKYNYKIYSYNSTTFGPSYLTSMTLNGTASTNAVSSTTALNATNIGSAGFTANWNGVNCASNYELNVSYLATNNGVAGWTFPVSGTTVTADASSSITNANNIGKTITLSSGSISTVSGVTTSAASGTAWSTVGKNWQIIVNTTGYTNLTLSSAQYSSASGPKDFKVQYKIGAGGTWTDLVSAYTVATNFTTGVISNVSLPSECNNVSDLYIRWATASTTAVNGSTIGGTNTGGTSRIDDIIIKGTTIKTVPQYTAITVNGTSASVTGLSPLTTYYYSVKSKATNSVAASSNTITVYTTADQTLADFRTKASGDYTNPAIWEYLADSVNYLPATIAPDSTNNISIRSTDSVYMNRNIVLNSGKTFTVNGTIEMNNKVVSGTGSFNLLAGSTVYTANENGLYNSIVAGVFGSVITANRTFDSSANYIFNGSATQYAGSLPSKIKGLVLINNPAGVILNTSKTVNVPGSFVVASNSMLDFGTSGNPLSVGGTGSFTAKTGSTLIIRYSAGIIANPATGGCVRTTSRSFENGVNYDFSKDDGSSQSNFGSAFGTEITNINNLKINNPKGVNLTSSNITVNGTLSLVSGVLKTGDYKVTLAPSASMTKTDTSWVYGNFEKNVPVGQTSMTYELGDSLGHYTPATVSFGNVSTAGNVSVGNRFNQQANMATSGLDSTKRLIVYHNISGSGIVYDNYAASFNFANPTITANQGFMTNGGNVRTAILGKYDNGWSYPSTATRTDSSFSVAGQTSFGDYVLAESGTTYINTKLYLEGAYAGAGMMNPTLFDLGLSTNPMATDSVSVCLWKPTSLSAANPDYTVKGLLRKDGSMKVSLPSSVIGLGKTAYIALKHRNSIELWSANPVTITGSTNYDFTTGLGQAFGDGINPPMKDMGGVYAMYSGNVDQDPTIDINDMSATENDAFDFAFGYNATDCNGDGASDALDMQIIENNAILQIYTARP